MKRPIHVMVSLLLVMQTGIAAEVANVAEPKEFPGAAEPLKAGNWEDHGLSLEDREIIRKAFRNGIQLNAVPGGSMLIMHKGEVVFREAFGVADSDTGRPFTLDLPCRIASVTKPHTATMLAILDGQGKLSLEDPIDKYLPEFNKVEVQGEGPAKRRPTIAECLSHTAGFQGNNAIRTGRFKLNWDGTLAEVVSELATQPLKGEPGTKYAYSRLGYMTAGRIAEVVTGEEFSDAMRSVLLEPVGATGATFNPSEEMAKQIPTAYERAEGGKIRPRQGQRIGTVINPGGGLTATLDDVARVMLLHMNRGSVKDEQIVPAGLLEKMYARQPATQGTGYGLGFRIFYERPDGKPGRLMHVGAAGTLAVIDFELDLVVVVFSQVSRQELGWRRRMLTQTYEIFESKLLK